jgi:hypothetical protein
MFKTANAIRNHLKQREQILDKIVRVYQLVCADCLMKYRTQTGRAFKTRFKEHLQAIGANARSCRLVKHILNTECAYIRI